MIAWKEGKDISETLPDFTEKMKERREIVEAIIFQPITSPSEGGWFIARRSQNDEVSRGLGQFFHDIAGKPTLNLDLVLHSIVTWAR